MVLDVALDSIKVKKKITDSTSDLYMYVYTHAYADVFSLKWSDQPLTTIYMYILVYSEDRSMAKEREW